GALIRPELNQRRCLTRILLHGFAGAKGGYRPKSFIGRLAYFPPRRIWMIKKRRTYNRCILQLSIRFRSASPSRILYDVVTFKARGFFRDSGKAISTTGRVVQSRLQNLRSYSG